MRGLSIHWVGKRRRRRRRGRIRRKRRRRRRRGRRKRRRRKGRRKRRRTKGRRRRGKRRIRVTVREGRGNNQARTLCSEGVPFKLYTTRPLESVPTTASGYICRRGVEGERRRRGRKEGGGGRV